MTVTSVQVPESVCFGARVDICPGETDVLVAISPGSHLSKSQLPGPGGPKGWPSHVRLVPVGVLRLRMVMVTALCNQPY